LSVLGFGRERERDVAGEKISFFPTCACLGEEGDVQCRSK